MPAPILYACRYSFAMSTRVCNVLTTDFVKKSGFECCFWSAQCIEIQARTTDNVKTWVFISLNVQWWSFIDNVVYCNILRSIKPPFLELVKAMFTGSTLVPMFTIITPGPYTHSKQSKAFHAKCNLEVKCEKKWVWYQNWLYECYRSQSNSQIYMPCNWRF